MEMNEKGLADDLELGNEGEATRLSPRRRFLPAPPNPTRTRSRKALTDGQTIHDQHHHLFKFSFIRALRWKMHSTLAKGRIERDDNLTTDARDK